VFQKPVSGPFVILKTSLFGPRGKHCVNNKIMHHLVINILPFITSLAQKWVATRLFSSPALEQGYETRIDWRATFQRKNAPKGRSLMRKMLMRPTNFQKNSENDLNEIKIYHFVSFRDVRRLHICIWHLRPLL
jgi:hypothetical protein